MDKEYVGKRDWPCGRKLTMVEPVIEIVRCRDCKFVDCKTWHCNRHCVGIFDDSKDIVYRITVHPTFFCSEGVRA